MHEPLVALALYLYVLLAVLVILDVTRQRESIRPRASITMLKPISRGLLGNMSYGLPLPYERAQPHRQRIFRVRRTALRKLCA